MDKAIWFIKQNCLSIAVAFGVIVFTSVVYFSVDPDVLRVPGVLLFLVAAYDKNKDVAINKYKKANKNLTEEEIKNIFFVKKWEQIRKQGRWNYIIKDGVFIGGLGCAIVLSLLTFMMVAGTIDFLMAAPGNMLMFIGSALIIGFSTGGASHWLMWPKHERRFIILTDPLNHEFSLKTLQEPD
jgi:hypothetical protein